MHVRTVKFAEWSALFFAKLQDVEQTALILYRNGYPFSSESKAEEFRKWFAHINSELFWGDCGRVETDFQHVRFVFANQWLAERFEWRMHGRMTFLDGTLETAPRQHQA